MKQLLLLLFLLPAVSALDGYDQPRNGFSADSNVRVLDTAVYNTGYLSEDGTDWTAFSLSGTERGNWIVGEATADVDLFSTRYVAIFSCNWNQGWSCGSTWQVADRELFTDTNGSLQGDYQALMELYKATNGDSWWENTGWQTSTPETMNEMYGITVYPQDHEFAGRVRGIDLFQNNLVGSIENVSFDKLTATQNLTLKQPLTEQEFYDSEPDSQVATNPPTKLYGELPASLGGMKNLEWLSLGGQYCIIDLSASAWNEWNHCPGFGSGKKYVNANFFEGELPSEWGALNNLQMIEIRRSNLQGSVPDSWEGMTSLVGVFLNDNLLSGELPAFSNSKDLRHIFFNYNKRRNTPHNGFTGPIPESYGQLTNLNHLRLNYNSLSGELPLFEVPTNIHTFDIGRNQLVRFPMEIFQEGRNPRLNYFIVGGNKLGGTLTSRDIDPNNHNIQYIALSGAELEGQVPNWATKLTADIFGFADNKFTSLGEEFYNPNAPVWGDVRNVALHTNLLNGELPDVLFASVSHQGVVVDMSSSTTIQLDMDLGAVESGTITGSSSDWIHDASKIGVWENHWIDYLVQIDPSGRNIVFEVRESGNHEKGYLYAREQADVSATNGLDYVIRPSVEKRIIRFKVGNNHWIARDIIDSNIQLNTVTLDEPLNVDVTGREFNIHERRSGTWNIHFYSNNLSGPIPQSWGYIPTNRDARVLLANNELSGVIPDFSRIGIHNQGSLDTLSYTNNRFVFAEIIPNFVANQATANSHYYAPQKPFGEQRTISLNSDVTITDFEDVVTHEDNVYQWLRNDEPISGQTSKTLTTSQTGEYVLQVTNPNIPELTLYSQPITVE